MATNQPRTARHPSRLPSRSQRTAAAGADPDPAAVEHVASYAGWYAQSGHPLTSWSYVLEHGTVMPGGAPIPRVGPLGQCFSNAGRIALETRYRYCEGFALSNHSLAMLVQHAWIVDENGTAWETTWPHGGASYFGIVFSDRCHREALAEHGTWDLLDAMIRRTLDGRPGR